MAQQTGKQRAIRIPLDYFKQPDRMSRWKLRLALVAFIACLAWLAVNLLAGDARNYDYARGPVAAVHATWEDNCNACHVPFVPIADRTWIDDQQWFQKFAGGQPRDVANARCQHCHTGPDHHTGQLPNLSCASCHRDHQGREFNLTRVVDHDCTQCHANLPPHTAPGSPTPVGGPYANVTAFTTNHPDFRSIKKDPGKLRFNHALHMTAGMVLDADARQKWTLADVGSDYRERYRQRQPEGQRDDAAPVQLECASCHQLSSGDFKIDKPLPALPGSVMPERTLGAYMLPIVYENQCQGCHPLNFEPNPKGQLAARVPHGIQPDQVTEYLWGVYAERNVQAKKFVPRRLVPGNDVTQEEKDARTELEKSLDAAQRYLYQSEMKVFPDKTTCGECHHYEESKGLIPQAIVRPDVPQFWYQHGTFNHARHRGVDCRVCHPNAFAQKPDGSPNPLASKDATDVLVPGIDNCRQCHAPHYRRDGLQLGGARFDCAECHTYHHRNKPADWKQGIGAAARDPKPTLNLEQFLKGSP
ncbi:MAG: hypothetical protein AB7K24_26075 [Gemmataceae bacterium]